MKKNPILITLVMLIIFCGGSANATSNQISQNSEGNTRLSEQRAGRSPETWDTAAQQGTSVLEFKFLKMYQSGSWAKVDFSLKNRSDQFIGFWQVSADLFDSKGEYLAHSYTNGHNLRAGQSLTATILVPDVRASAIKSWKLFIDNIRVEKGSGTSFDATRYYKLKELE